MLEYKKGICMVKCTKTQSQKKYLPTNDVIFKCLFGNAGNEQITRNFLEYVVGEKIEEISTDFKLDLLKEKPNDKQMVSDLIAKDNKLQKYIIEMQKKAFDYLPDRFIAYISKTYVADIKVKEGYENLKRTVLVILMEEDFPNLNDISEYHTVWHYREQNHQDKILTKNTEIHILELKKYKKYKKNGGKTEPWLEFFINPYGKEVEEMARTRAELEEAVKQLRKLSADEEVQALADAEDWARYDYNSMMAEMKRKGLEAGIEKGIEKGLKEGRAESKKVIAKKMKELNLDISVISTATGLTEEQIKKL